MLGTDDPMTILIVIVANGLCVLLGHYQNELHTSCWHPGESGMCLLAHGIHAYHKKPPVYESHILDNLMSTLNNKETVRSPLFFFLKKK